MASATEVAALSAASATFSATGWTSRPPCRRSSAATCAGAAADGLHGPPRRRRRLAALGHLDVAERHLVLHHAARAGDDRGRLGDLLLVGDVGAQRDALLDGLHGHRGGLAREDLPVVHGRHDVVRRAVPCSSAHLGELLGGGDAHLVGDRLGAHVEGAAEDAGEAQASC